MTCVAPILSAVLFDYASSCASSFLAKSSLRLKEASLSCTVYLTRLQKKKKKLTYAPQRSNGAK